MKSDLPNTPDLPESPADEQTNALNNAQSPEALRRGFLKRFGGYATTAPLVMFTLMSSQSSKAAGSITEGGG